MACGSCGKGYSATRLTTQVKAKGSRRGVVISDARRLSEMFAIQGAEMLPTGSSLTPVGGASGPPKKQE